MISWERFEAARAGHLAALAVVIQDSVQRHDTQWPVFHGSYDWHSAVHGVYALHVIYRLSGDEESLRIADSVLTAEAIQVVEVYKTHFEKLNTCKDIFVTA